MSLVLNPTFLSEIESNNIHGSDFELLINILNKADNELGGCFASNKNLAESLHMNWATISRKISKLIKKGLLTVKYLFTNKKRGKKVVVNGKEYLVYRLLMPAHQTSQTVRHTATNNTAEMAQSQDVVTVQNNQTIDNQVEMVTSVVEEQSTPNAQAKNVASAETKDNYAQDELRQKAYELAKKRQGVKNIDGYVKGMLNQWHKQGINTVAQLKEKQGFLFNEIPKTKTNRYGKRKPIVEKMPSWFVQTQAEEKAKKEEKDKAEANKTQAEKAEVRRDIDRLMVKLGIKTKEQIVKEKVEREANAS